MAPYTCCMPSQQSCVKRHPPKRRHGSSGHVTVFGGTANAYLTAHHRSQACLQPLAHACAPDATNTRPALPSPRHVPLHRSLPASAFPPKSRHAQTSHPGRNTHAPHRQYTRAAPHITTPTSPHHPPRLHLSPPNSARSKPPPCTPPRHSLQPQPHLLAQTAPKVPTPAPPPRFRRAPPAATAAHTARPVPARSRAGRPP